MKRCRRRFLRELAMLAAAPVYAGPALYAAAALPNTGAPLRAAIIGWTGRGDYGHSLDTIFNGRPGIEVVAVADPDAAGGARAAARSRARRQYADYREMLAAERPQVVSVAPRWSEHRHAMGLAVMGVGAHWYSEKPFAPTLCEADELIAAAGRAGLRIAVAHQARLAPSVLELKRALSEGWLGELVQLRAWGKQDARAGGEDMLVLGSHVFDLMRFFAGDPLWCTARVQQDGRDITRRDGRAVLEQIGPVAGGAVEAQFAFPRGVLGTFTSRAELREHVGVWGLELTGSLRTARIVMDSMCPSVHVLESGAWQSEGRKQSWTRWDDPERPAAAERGLEAGNRRVVDDWLEAIRTGREPICNGVAALKALEMVMAVYDAALSGARAALPLARRSHPLVE
jgi:predicted dehydrogenase